MSAERWNFPSHHSLRISFNIFLCFYFNSNIPPSKIYALRYSLCHVQFHFQLPYFFVLFQKHTHKYCFNWRFVCDKCACSKVDFRCSPHFVEQQLIFFSQRPTKFTPCFSLFVDNKGKRIVVASHRRLLLSSFNWNPFSYGSRTVIISAVFFKRRKRFSFP